MREWGVNRGGVAAWRHRLICGIHRRGGWWRKLMDGEGDLRDGLIPIRRLGIGTQFGRIVREPGEVTVGKVLRMRR